MSHQKRLIHEARLYNRDPHPKISILADGEPWSEKNASSHDLLAILDGPQGTPYEKYKLKMAISIQESYPHSPPRVYFKPPIYHVNIEPTTGEPDLVNFNQWSPGCKIIRVLTEILELLQNPDPSHGIDPTICQEFVNDRDSYNKKAEKSAKMSSKSI